MIIKISGTVDSIQERESNGKKEYHVFLNQPGEQIKPKLKFVNGHPVPPLGEDVEFIGRLVAGVWQNKPYQFVRVG